MEEKYWTLLFAIIALIFAYFFSQTPSGLVGISVALALIVLSLTFPQTLLSV